MGEKKQPGLFTLQFNLEDPQQQTVSELLEQQGRHKAQFITSAVLLYIQCPKPQGLGGEPPGTEEPPAPAAPISGPWADAMGDDALKAINDTLAAFQQG